ncbi:MAG TPA: MBL fold metallo-hydrolase [Candidatus Obscuribacterales bacterium]
MLKLPEIETVFPENDRAAIFRFWLAYWCVFFLLLPWMLLRQFGITGYQAIGVFRNWKRELELIPGSLSLLYLNNLRSLLVTLVFGERFTLIRYKDVLIDPGPIFAVEQIRPLLKALKGRIEAILVTHAHEEHIGNAPMAAALLEVPVYGTAVTLEALRRPAPLSLPRRTFIGQPLPAEGVTLRLLESPMLTPASRFEIIASPGHCDGHASVYDPERGILFAGDSFMHTVFTSPNVDVSGADWIETLRRYCRLPIRTMIGTHGLIYSTDPDIPERPFIVSRMDPQQLVADKLAFMEWATAVVAEGERLGLSYRVIEACLFPWSQWWSWYNWFSDESGRLFSAGEFSRTHFVRSLSATPKRVPVRFPFFVRLKQAVLDRLR